MCTKSVAPGCSLPEPGASCFVTRPLASRSASAGGVVRSGGGAGLTTVAAAARKTANNRDNDRDVSQILMRLLLISSSNVHGYGFLDHAEESIRRFVGEKRRVVFAPFAGKDRDAYTSRVAERLGRMSLETTQLRHGANDLEGADVLFVGGGNTFRLLKALYERELLEPIRRKVRSGTLLYIGSSAGTN